MDSIREPGGTTDHGTRLFLSGRSTINDDNENKVIVAWMGEIRNRLPSQCHQRRGRRREQSNKVNVLSTNNLFAGILAI
jgi:hypothetical protein